MSGSRVISLPQPIRMMMVWVGSSQGVKRMLCSLKRGIPEPWRVQTAAFSSAQTKEPFYGSPRPKGQDNKHQLPSLVGFVDSVASILENVPSNNRLDRLSLTLRQASIAIQDPTRADAVAAVGELTGTLALQKLHQVMRQHPVGCEILKDKPLVSKATIPHERLLKEAQATKTADDDSLTFGQAYGRFLERHHFDPDERDSVRFVDDPELAYVMLRYRQSHDFYHVLTGLPPTVLGELALKWLELFQTGLPMTAFAGTVGGWSTLPHEEQQFLWRQQVPWAQRTGQSKTMPFGTLLCVYYEREWETPLVVLRRRIGMEEPVPQYTPDVRD